MFYCNFCNKNSKKLLRLGTNLFLAKTLTQIEILFSLNEFFIWLPLGRQAELPMENSKVQQMYVKPLKYQILWLIAQTSVWLLVAINDMSFTMWNDSCNRVSHNHETLLINFFFLIIWLLRVSFKKWRKPDGNLFRLTLAWSEHKQKL